VVIDRAWKKLIWDGSRPVGPGGIITSIGATEPTLAGVGTLFDSMIGLSSKTGLSEKMRPILPLHKLARFSNYGSGVHNLFLSS